MILLPCFYAIADASCFRSIGELTAFAEELMAAGCTLLQYRNKSGNARAMLEQARELRRQSRARAPAPQVRLVMNDRADLCLVAEFDGVHVGQDDLSPDSVRGSLAPTAGLEFPRTIPSKCGKRIEHRPIISPLGLCFRPPAKSKPDPVVGLEGVRRARQLTRKPLVAIGGITRANAASVIEAGADSVAVISDLLREPRKSAEEFFRILR